MIHVFQNRVLLLFKKFCSNLSSKVAIQQLNTSIKYRSLVHNLNDYNLSYEFGKPMNGCVSYSPLTIGELIKRSSALDPNRLAIIVAHQNIQKTYKQFNSDVDQLAAALYSIGCRRGSIVGLWAINCYEWLLTQFATGKLGCIMVAINPGYKEYELSTSMKLVGIDTLIMNQRFKTSNYYQIMKSISPGLFSTAKGHKVHSKELPKLKNLIVIDQPQGETDIVPINICRFSELMKKAIDIKNLPGEETQFDDVINVQFTSGTTGAPKGSMLTHHNIIQNIQFVSPIIFEGFGISKQEKEEKPIICLPNPLYHSFGSVIGSLASIYVHATIVLPAPVFNPYQTLSTIEKFKCNYLYGTPTMWSDLLHGPLDKFNLTTLKRGLMSGSPCPPVLVENLFKSISSLEHILIPYGSTEVGPIATCTTVHDTRQHQLESVGRPIPFVEIKVIDLKTGRLLPRGERGEICIRSHGTFAGYMNQPDKTKEVLDNNFWYHTGDVGWMDSQGYLRISSRIKEMIIRGGENIYPREVEELILETINESIESVYVVGIPDERFGEELVAYVKLKIHSTPMTEEELKNCLKKKISHFKIPKYIRFVEDFPRTPTGKVRKVELKQMAMKQFGASVQAMTTK